MERVLGRYRGKDGGPLLVVLGAVHGNEPAGVKAIEVVFKMLEIEPYINDSFDFNGHVLGLIGNIQAYQSNKRYIQRDLNRVWSMRNIEMARTGESTVPEKFEMLDIYELILEEIKETNPSKVVVLDMHTTSSDGGIFSIPSNDPLSLAIAEQLHAPVVTGMLTGLGGTSLHFFNKENVGIETTAVVFESGQHVDPLSVNRAVAGIINCMRTIGCVRSDDIHNKHDDLLIAFSKDLPLFNKLVYSHDIDETTEFRMKPGFTNFQRISKGDHLADDKNGKVFSPVDGMILMPLYQKQGEDGFFIISEEK